MIKITIKNIIKTIVYIITILCESEYIYDNYFTMKDDLPIVGITMGDPVGIGPEVILLALREPIINQICMPLVIGDVRILEFVGKCSKSDLHFNKIQTAGSGVYKQSCVDVVNVSDLDPDKISWGSPTMLTGQAMVSYIEYAVNMAMNGEIDAVVTGPINKASMKMAGSSFAGHTELLSERTKAEDVVMMLAGDKLRVVLVTIHIPLNNVSAALTSDGILKTIEITRLALSERFGIKEPRLAVAALNPHAGEEGIFGNEEKQVITPAIRLAKNRDIKVSGPFPPDTVFYNAAKGAFDAVVCMYHDQGLIPFKMIHFTDGVNTTLGLPIIRTSVDHGTAYDIAGTGKADPGSLIAAIKMAAEQAVCTARNAKK